MEWLADSEPDVGDRGPAWRHGSGPPPRTGTAVPATNNCHINSSGTLYGPTWATVTSPNEDTLACSIGTIGNAILSSPNPYWFGGPVVGLFGQGVTTTNYTETYPVFGGNVTVQHDGSTTIGAPRMLGPLDIGVQVYRDKGFEVRAEYNLQANDT